MARSRQGSKHMLPSGRWRVSVTHGGHRFRDTVETERDADTRIAQLAAELGARPNLGRGTTLSQWWAVYQATKGARLAGTTRARYAQTMEGHVLPAFGGRDISTIGRHEIQALLLAQYAQQAFPVRHEDPVRPLPRELPDRSVRLENLLLGAGCCT